jgi:hypothetical protein
MKEFKFACPHCEQHMVCDEQHSGRQIQCPGCHHLLVIPPAPGRTAHFVEESGMTWATYLDSGVAPAALKPPLPPPPSGKRTGG